MKSTISTLAILIGVATSPLAFSQQGSPPEGPAPNTPATAPANGSAMPAQKAKMPKKQHKAYDDALKACKKETSTQAQEECTRLARQEHNEKKMP